MLNSHDEWSPLKEVIVGNCFNANISALDLSFKLFFNDNAYYFWQKDQKGNHLIRSQYIEELEEDLNELVMTLESFDIKVLRPTPLEKMYKFKTPYWESTCVPALNVRDQAIILGKEIIETAPCIRSRYFENDLLKPIFYQYFHEGADWTVMPRPMMTDNSFDLSYTTNQGFTNNIDFIDDQVDNEFDFEQEIMIDAAQITRFGKDLLINVANRNHLLGYNWLRRHLVPRGYRLYKLRNIADNHTDSFIVPLKEGRLMLRNKGIIDKLPLWLKKWDILIPPEPKDNWFPDYPSDQLYLTSKYIDLNVLSIDGEHIIVNSLCPELINFLEQNGFTPVPVRHRHRRIFAGGFHCFTLDTVREGDCNDYST
jgi:glycine amidinotransferase